jgi:hypothetical protein
LQVFIANGSLRNWEFMYRVPENPTVRRLQIRAGGQERFPEDFSDAALPEVVKQLHRVGAVPHNNVDASRSPSGLIYRVGKPIGSDDIDEAREHDVQVRQDIAGDKTEAAGLASFATLARPNPDAINDAQLEVVQLTNQGEPERGGVNFEAEVSRKAPTGAKRVGKRRG